MTTDESRPPQGTASTTTTSIPPTPGIAGEAQQLDLFMPSVPELREAWRLVAAVLPEVPEVDLGYLPVNPSAGVVGQTAINGPWRRRNDPTLSAMQVRVRPHLTGDRLLCTLLHEGCHVAASLPFVDRPWAEGNPHGPHFRSQVVRACDRLGLPVPARRWSYWPMPQRVSEVAAAVRAHALAVTP